MMYALRRWLYYAIHAFKPHKSRTVRLAFPMFFVGLSLLSAAALLYDNTTYIRLASNKTAIKAGETVSIDVYVGANTPVNAVEIKLRFPSDQLEVTSIDTGGSVITLWTQEPVVKGNEVILSGGTFRKGFIGEHLIASVKARALQSGNAEFSTAAVTLLAGDGSGKAVPLTNKGNQTIAIQVTPTDGRIVGEVKISIATDIDGDGKVTLSDVLAFLAAWRDQNMIYDFNHDRRMSFVDFSIILADTFLK